MLTKSELDILKRAAHIKKKKMKIEEENEKNEFDNKKRKVFENEKDKLLKKKQNLLNEIDNIDKAMEKYKIVTLKGIKHNITKIDQELKILGEYTGQCLHIKKEMQRRPNFAWYDGCEEYYICSLCKIEL